MFDKEEFIEEIVKDSLYTGINYVDYWDGSENFWDRIENNLYWDYECGSINKEAIGKRYDEKVTKEDKTNFMNMFNENKDEIKRRINEVLDSREKFRKYWDENHND